MERIVIHVITDLHMKDIDGDEYHAEAVGEQGLFFPISRNFKTYAEIANEQTPDFVIALGDCIHGACPPEKFMQTWHAIKSPKALIPGNHDLDDYTQLELAEHFGYGASNIAGSPFQQAIVLKKAGVSCRILMLDTSFTADNQSSNHWQNCRVNDATLDWIRQQLKANEEEYVLLCSHVSPHQFDMKDFYDAAQARQLQTIVSDYIALHSNVKVINFAGHAHPECPEWVNTLGTKFPAVIFPSMIRQRDNIPTGGPNGVYTIVVLEPDHLDVEMKWIQYG